MTFVGRISKLPLKDDGTACYELEFNREDLVYLIVKPGTSQITILIQRPSIALASSMYVTSFERSIYFPSCETLRDRFGLLFDEKSSYRLIQNDNTNFVDVIKIKITFSTTSSTLDARLSTLLTTTNRNYDGHSNFQPASTQNHVQDHQTQNSQASKHPCTTLEKFTGSSQYLIESGLPLSSHLRFNRDESRIISRIAVCGTSLGKVRAR
ncbi:uncharacterized protein MEPE_02177 [Melanopsichium pennsylvanicum]|uniref:Uncharacterized protein n=1 Tax=Melanopsichium pennsylvanicum TaxID=63383 RepID=A0AAJ4XJU1_9BASI|nr:uncharacterized protein MEPE_02177 [Melanopsichium pennsylvanicum]